MAFDTGIPIAKIDLILDSLDEVVVHDGWLFIEDFIYFQQRIKPGKSLNPDNNAHKNILERITKNLPLVQKCSTIQKNLAPYEEVLRGYSSSNTIGKSNSLDQSKGAREVWNKEFKCRLCGTDKGHECKLKGECGFPDNLSSLAKKGYG